MYYDFLGDADLYVALWTSHPSRSACDWYCCEAKGVAGQKTISLPCGKALWAEVDTSTRVPGSNYYIGRPVISNNALVFNFCVLKEHQALLSNGKLTL